MSQVKNVGYAFAMGAQVTAGELKESVALGWIESAVNFHAAHPDAHDTCDPEEVRGALTLAYEHGKESGVSIPKPTPPAASEVEP